MSITCQDCRYENPDGTVYCVRCGKLMMQGQGMPQSPQGYFSSGQGGEQAQQQVFQQPAPMVPPQVLPASSGLGSLRRAFAGHGTLIKHHSWLLDGKQTQVMQVRQVIFDKLMQRNLDASQTSVEKLTDQGMIDERRDYIKIRRKSTTVFIYATPASNDLYISRATTVQPGLSLLRVIALALGLLLIIFPFFSLVTAVSSAAAGAAAGANPSNIIGGALFSIILLLFFSLPLLWFLVIALARSLASWALDKDFWVLLRPNYLTEFQRDEIAMMEHMTDTVVQEAMKQLGLDADKIIAPPNGYQPAGRIRLI